MSDVPEGYREAVAYLQIEGRQPGPYGGSWGDQATAVRMTQDKPKKPVPGAVVVKVRLQVPRSAFEPLQPEAIIRVPEDLVQKPVYVDADDPEAGGSDGA